jgi:hypothetical protein
LEEEEIMSFLPYIIFACSEYNLDEPGKLVSPEDEEEEIEIELQAPIAIAGPSLRATKGENVILTGLESYDPDDSNPTLTYAWTLTDIVQGATIVFEGSDTPEPVFSSDVLGRYVATLQVSDDDGIISENYAATLIEVVPHENLIIEVDWDVAGVDVDLHLISPSGSYYGEGDCFFGNPSPDWGVLGDPNDDPQLLLDDEGQEKREMIQLISPEEGMYTVYVTYYNQRESEYPYVTPSISVIGAGQVLYEAEGPRLTSEGKVWRAGFLYWDALHFEPDVTLLEHADIGGPVYND